VVVKYQGMDTVSESPPKPKNFQITYE